MDDGPCGVRYEALTPDNFDRRALDGFVRHQEVTACWRCVDGAWRLLPIAFTEDWDLDTRRAIAADIAERLGGALVAFGAFCGGALVGYAAVGTARFGSGGQYADLADFEVSEPYRGRGIGRQLFTRACAAARALGAAKLYISAHSARESQAAYRRLGCVPAEEPDPAHVEREPCDVQLEYAL